MFENCCSMFWALEMDGYWWNFNIKCWYNLFCTFSQTEGDFSSKHKWKLKQMCKRHGTNHLQGSFSGCYTMNVPRYYVLRFAKKLYAIKPAKWQKGESLEICPSAGLKLAEHDITSRMTPGVDIRTCETLTQNTFWPHYWQIIFSFNTDTCSANRKISSSEQVGFRNHCNTLWAVNASAKTTRWPSNKWTSEQVNK